MGILDGVKPDRVARQRATEYLKAGAEANGRADDARLMYAFEPYVQPLEHFARKAGWVLSAPRPRRQQMTVSVDKYGPFADRGVATSAKRADGHYLTVSLCPYEKRGLWARWRGESEVLRTFCTTGYHAEYNPAHIYNTSRRGDDGGLRDEFDGVVPERLVEFLRTVYRRLG